MFHYLVSVLLHTCTILVIEKCQGITITARYDCKKVENQVSCCVIFLMYLLFVI